MINNALWIVLFAVGLLALNWPILEIPGDRVYGYLLLFWLLFVLLLALATRSTKLPPSGR